MHATQERNMSLTRIGTRLPANILNALNEYVRLAKLNLFSEQDKDIDIDSICHAHGVVSDDDKRWLSDELICVYEMALSFSQHIAPKHLP